MTVTTLEGFYHATDHGERYEFDWYAIQLEEPRPPLSPSMLIQEMMPTPFWVVVSSMMMCRTRRKHGHECTWRLLLRYQDHTALAFAKKSDVMSVIKPAGFADRRSSNIIDCARMWSMGIRPWPVEKFLGESMAMPGVGEYVTNAYRMFVHGELNLTFNDDELRRFAVWAHARRRRGFPWKHPHG